MSDVTSAAEASSKDGLVQPNSKVLKHAPVKITVFGSGSYGTATAAHLAKAGFEVWILTRRAEVALAVTATHKNPASSFADYTLPYNLTATTSAADALRGTSLIVHCIPVQASYNYLRELRDLIPPDVTVVNTSKGMYVYAAATTAGSASDAVSATTSANASGVQQTQGDAAAPTPAMADPCDGAAAPGGGCSWAPPVPGEILLPARLIPAALGRPQPVAVLSGPTFAEEVLRGFPSGAVVASCDPAVAAAAKAAFETPSFRVWTSPDVIGVEVAGALKNVYALAAGCVEGLGLGLNTTAMLCTRALAEENKLARALGSSEATMAGLSGVGDLMLTCFGKASRNRTVGVRLGKGETVAAILASMTEVAEGVATAPVALRLARANGVSVPIVEAIVAVLEGKLAPISALMALLQVPTGGERIL